jgi:hypothetical protein
VGAAGPIPVGKVRRRRDADCLPPSGAEGKNEQELYFISHPRMSTVCSATTLLQVREQWVVRI